MNDRISVKSRHKRKHDDRTLEIKYNKALVEFEKGKTNKDMAKLFVSKNFRNGPFKMEIRIDHDIRMS